MKRLSTVILMTAITLAAMAQDKKPTQGAFGIAYGVDALPFQQAVTFSGYITDNIELGGSIFLTMTRQRNSTLSDSVAVAGTTGIVYTDMESRNVTNTTTFGISPMIRGHFNTKNNLDIYLGGVIPIGVACSSSVSTSTWEGDNFSRTAKVVTKGTLGAGSPPTTLVVGAGVTLGCRWFFYENLALGAETNLGVLFNMNNGRAKSTASATNEGSNNPLTGTTIDDVETEDPFTTKNETMTLGLMRGIGFNLSWYFGGGGKTE